MPALRELQQAFVGALLSGNGQTVAAWVREDGLAAAERLQIYRNNTRANFLATLRATYPVVERLGGGDWFAQQAWRYQLRHPSRSGDLQYVGERFPGFIGAALAGTNYAWFADVARLEWAYQEVLTAADAPRLDLRRLATVAPEDYGALRFALHPALRMVASRYPVLAIWRANQGHAPDDARVDLDGGRSRVLLTRQADHVELRECPPGLFALARALGAGRPLAAAAALAGRVDDSIDLADGLRRLATLGALRDFRVGPVPPARWRTHEPA